MRAADASRPAADWPRALRRYLVFIGAANLLWEALQLPLYTIWATGTAREIAFAVVHCTAGDFIIAGIALMLAVAMVGERAWPMRALRPVALLAIAFGLGYTIFSEWLNIVVRQSWAYSELMPVVPAIGTGLAPLAQWLVVPLGASWWARLGVAATPEPVENRR